MFIADQTLEWTSNKSQDFYWTQKVASKKNSGRKIYKRILLKKYMYPSLFRFSDAETNRYPIYWLSIVLVSLRNQVVFSEKKAFCEKGTDW